MERKGKRERWWKRKRGERRERREKEKEKMSEREREKPNNRLVKSTFQNGLFLSNLEIYDVRSE